MTDHPDLFGYGGYISFLVEDFNLKKVSSEKTKPHTPQRRLSGVGVAKMPRSKKSKSYRMVNLYPVPLPNFGSYPKAETKGLRKYWYGPYF